MNTDKNGTEKNISAFFELVRAGLWSESDLNLDCQVTGHVDWGEVYRLSEEQCVVGLVAAGIER